ncbi:arsenate reductase (glutaredoxin) [soil metagenome]|nr:ArsC/Spx/MgsR family protein [Pyrinomonadaceae bacterium]
MNENITVYEKPTCTTCRNLAELLRENGIEYERVNYFIDELTEEKLRALLKKANLSPLEVLRKKEPLFKELNISEDMPSEKIIKLVIENPSLLQRPIVEVGDRAVLARPVERALDLIK